MQSIQVQNAILKVTIIRAVVSPQTDENCRMLYATLAGMGLA